MGPNYVRPQVDTAANFKEMENWKQAQPGDQGSPAKWWEAFGDPLLNSLEEQMLSSNPSVLQAEARYRQALALLQTSQASALPTVSANLQNTRSASGSSKLAGTTTSVAGEPSNQHNLGLSASWEVDLWGRVRRSIESNQASTKASEGDLYAARLSTQAQLAQTYFQLRAADGQRRLLNDTVDEYRRSLDLTRNQYKVGVVPQENVVQAETQLRSTEAQALDIQVQRATLEHAIAVLVGKSPSNFSIPTGDLTQALVPVLPILPSSLLERRPDVAAAERRVAAANAQIGVAKSAWFPDLTINASGGYQSNSIAHWFTLPNRVWSIGPTLAETLFDGGARSAQSDSAIAAYDGTVAAYRGTVLSAFQDVEDNLATLRILEQEAKVQEDAVRLARRSVELTTNQYKAGVVNYLNVVTAQTTSLTNQRTALDIQSRRLTANVLLIKALGGGWKATELEHAPVLTQQQNQK